MYDRLIKVDALTQQDHPHISEDDECYHLGEFTARAGYAHSATNDLIQNLKKPMERRNKPAEWKWKERAIEQIANNLKLFVNGPILAGRTFVPVPSSKVKADPHYDDRLSRILSGMAIGSNVDIRDVILQSANTAASHEADDRLSPQKLYELYRINESCTAPAPNKIAIFDDVLTVGSHYKAMKMKLSERFPGVPILGLFVARRVISNNAADDFSDLDT